MLENLTTFQNKQHWMFSEKAYKAYKLYMAAKLHYTSDTYNAAIANGRVRGSRKAFSSRNDQPLFLKFANRFENEQDMVQCLIANFAYGNADVIYNDSEAERNYKEWIKRKQSIHALVNRDFDIILLHAQKEKLDYNSVFRFNNDMYPELLKLFLGNAVTLETMVVIENIDPYLKHWNQHMNFLWESERRRIAKSSSFVKFSSEKVLPKYNEIKQELQNG